MSKELQNRIYAKLAAQGVDPANFYTADQSNCPSYEQIQSAPAGAMIVNSVQPIAGPVMIRNIQPSPLIIQETHPSPVVIQETRSSPVVVQATRHGPLIIKETNPAQVAVPMTDIIYLLPEPQITQRNVGIPTVVSYQKY